MCVSALGDTSETQPLVEVLALREEHGIVTNRLGAKLGDGEIWRETAGHGANFRCLLEQSGEGQCAGQDKVGVPPVRVYLDRFAQALDSANYPPEINIGEPDEKVPLEEERIARAEPH